MNKFALALGLAVAGLLTAPAQAAVPLLNFTCADGIAVHADKGGPVYIDGREARLEVFNDDYSEASLDGTTISIAINTDGTPALSYTGTGGANGVCSPTPGTEAFSTGGATIPFFNAECPGELFVHADQGGPIYLNGEEAVFESFSQSYFEAKAGDVTVSVTNMPDDTLDVSYSAAGGANGVCKLEQD